PLITTSGLEMTTRAPSRVTVTLPAYTTVPVPLSGSKEPPAAGKRKESPSRCAPPVKTTSTPRSPSRSLTAQVREPSVTSRGSGCWADTDARAPTVARPPAINCTTPNAINHPTRRRAGRRRPMDVVMEPTILVEKCLQRTWNHAEALLGHG